MVMMLVCLAAPQQDSAGEIPPYNKDATEPRDVYKLDDGILSQYVKRMDQAIWMCDC
jgi:hypothetical protein